MIEIYLIGRELSFLQNNIMIMKMNFPQLHKTLKYDFGYHNIESIVF